jgi:hypothetical protein
MPVARVFASAAVVQPIHGALAHRLEHPVAGRATGFRPVDDLQRLVVQHGQKGQRFILVRGRRDLGGGLQRPATGEGRHPAQQALLGLPLNAAKVLGRGL